MIIISCLQECLLCVVMVDKIRRPPSQYRSDFQYFLSRFEHLLINIEGFNPNVTVLLGDYNVQSRSWWPCDTSTPECLQLDALTSSYSLQQLVNEPTHILPNSSSFIDLIFTNQLGPINSGMHPSLHANCHYWITYCKLNLKIEYPPSYQHLVWNFKKTNTTSIRRGIHSLFRISVFQ